MFATAAPASNVPAPEPTRPSATSPTATVKPMAGLGNELHIESNQHGISLQGEIDAHTGPELERTLADLLESSPTSVEIDMSGVTFMDSSGLRVVLALTRRARGQGGDIVLVAPTSVVSRLVEVSGLQAHLTIRGEAT